MTAVNQRPHIVFTGGGTGGHLFPGLAVARRLAEIAPEVRITFAGGGKPLEQEHVAAAGLEYLCLRLPPLASPARRRGPLCRRQPARLPCGRTVSRRASGGGGGGTGRLHERADGSGCNAARHSARPVGAKRDPRPGQPLVGLSRRGGLRSFAQTGEHLPARCRVLHTGNPLRDGFNSQSEPGRQLLILGGSSGARTLNEQVPRAFAQVHAKLTGWKIVHQTGQADADCTGDLYRSLGVEATVVPFVTDMPGTLAQTQLAICRAGGTTLAELAVAAVPAILVPYPHAANNHQRLNADVFSAAGASLVLDDRDAPGQLDRRLAALLSELLDDPPRRAAMAQAMRRMAKPDAASEVARAIVELAADRVFTKQRRHRRTYRST